MSLFLVIGTAGTGKSTVCQELKERGYAAYDIDEDGLARWQHKETRFIHPKSSVKPHQRTPEFLSEHNWNVPRENVQALVDASGDKPLFICGAISNLDEIRPLAAGTVALYVGATVLAQRLRDRPGEGHWGKQPHEVELTLQAHAKVLDQYEQQSIPTIDATQPVTMVADQIIQLADGL